MGCGQSKIENEEAVARCKERKLQMKKAVAFRNAFAAAHSSYAMSLKNTGAALSDFAQAELPHHQSAGSSSSGSAAAIPSSSSSGAAVPPVVPDSQLPPPPPPLPDFPPPLQRAATMPEMKIQKQDKGRPAGPAIIEEDEMESEPQDNEKLIRKRGSSNRGTSGGAGGSNRGGTEGPSQHRQRRREEEAEAIGSQPAAATAHKVPQQDSAWDYFFPPVDSMPGPTLADPEPVEEQVRLNKEEIFEEKSKRVEEEDVGEKQQREPVVVEAEKVEKAVEVPVPVPVVPEKKAAKKTGGEGGGRRIGKPNLIQIFADLDDHFLKASESAHEVSKMLEATRLHYHSNFADNRGHIDHSARVMRVITWNRSFRGMPSVDDGKDDFDSEENETHATVLDKMLAWEKKLYDEVKEGELMKIEYQKKVASLNKHKNRGTNPESLEKLKAAVSHLHTRYIVDMQSLDSTVMEINRLRDKQLYPKLVQLVEGMATMWETMRVHHDTQLKVADLLKSHIFPFSKETSEHHHDRTYQLFAVVREWHLQFCKFVDNQKEYIKALNNWLKLNLIPIESSLKENVSSPPRVENPPIQRLIGGWDEYLGNLNDEVARTGINNFAAVIDTIMQLQEEEMKLKEKCEDTRKELNRRMRQFNDWKQKYVQQRTAEELDAERPENNTEKEAIAEREFIVDQLKKQLEDDEEAYQKQCLHVREKSLNSLKSRLPELFRAMSDVSLAFSHLYGKLRSML